MNPGPVEATNTPNPVEAFRRAHREIVSSFYEQSVLNTGRPVEFRLFDREICAELDVSWLTAEVKDYGVSRERLDEMIASGTIPKWSDSRGNQGFLLYTPEQVKTVEELGGLTRYNTAELRHIVQKWNEQIECSVEVIPYDELGGEDFAIYRSHVEREIEDLRRHKKAFEEHEGNSAPSLQLFQEQLTGWERTAAWLDSYDPLELPDRVRDRVSRRLFELRYLNEFVRISDAMAFRGRIIQGFSPEVLFSHWEQDWGGKVKWTKIDWCITLSEVQRSRAVGQQFPIHTPDFDLTEDGLQLRAAVTPAQYEELYQKYQLEDLFREAEKLGNELWHPSALASNTDLCVGCGTRFKRTVPTRRYCSETCRARAKQQRWRDRDPERARQAIARYWSSTYRENS